MNNVAGWELPVINISSKKAVIEAPKNSLSILRILFYKAGYNSGHIINVEMRSRIKVDDRYPIFSLGHVNRKTVELNIKSDDNYRYLFYTFPVKNTSIYNFHTNLKKAIDEFNFENYKDMNHSLEKSLVSPHTQTVSKHYSRSLKTPMADLFYKKFAEKINNPVKHDKTVTIQSEPIEEVTLEPINKVISEPIKEVEIPDFIKEESEQRKHFIEMLKQDDTLISVLMDYICEKAHDKYITKSNLIKIIDNQKFSCDSECVYSFLIRNEYVIRHSSRKELFFVNYIPLSNLNVAEVNYDEIDNDDDKISMTNEIEENYMDHLIRIKEKSDGYISSLNNLTIIKNNIKFFESEITKLKLQMEEIQRDIPDKKKAYEEFNLLKEAFKNIK